MAVTSFISTSLEAAKINNKQRDEIGSHLSKAAQEITNNLDFVAEQFGEHTENVTEHARIELAAYIGNAITRAGLTALNAPIALPGDDNHSVH